MGVKPQKGPNSPLRPAREILCMCLHIRLHTFSLYVTYPFLHTQACFYYDFELQHILRKKGTTSKGHFVTLRIVPFSQGLSSNGTFQKGRVFTIT